MTSPSPTVPASLSRGLRNFMFFLFVVAGLVIVMATVLGLALMDSPKLGVPLLLAAAWIVVGVTIYMMSRPRQKPVRFQPQVLPVPSHSNMRTAVHQPIFGGSWV